MAFLICDFRLGLRRRNELVAHSPKRFAVILAGLFLLAEPLPAQPANPAEMEEEKLISIVFDLLDPQPARRTHSLKWMETHWKLSFAPFLLDLLYANPAPPASRAAVWGLLQRMTGQSIEPDVIEWWKWLWKQEYEFHPAYPAFKAERYSAIDPRFRWWFYTGMKHDVRLDEIVWGGVRVDGIPPLDPPRLIAAGEADYLDDDNVVFGVFLDGHARAYPKRILAWHELFNDRIGDTAVTCAYCTLCGAAVLYRGELGGRSFDFGTSGFLFRSNKLMYDRQTRSLWSALEGVPVTGELVGSGLRLERLPIVTTTWKEWRRRHPNTQVLSLDTGFERDYGEGVAYRDYFATDVLMFPVPERDGRLPNKREVVGLILAGRPVAFDTEFLRANRLHQETIGQRSVVVLTDDSGANRVYDSGDVRFTRRVRGQLVDAENRRWQVFEDRLAAEGRELLRMPAHRAFWFGWRAQFPHTRLIR